MPAFAPNRISANRQPAGPVPTVCVVDRAVADYQQWHATARDAGVRLEVVATPTEALRLARAGAVDLWVINTELPGLSGCELCNMLKAQSPTATVYLVADQYSPATERAAWGARASMFGCKPAHTEWFDHWLQARRDRVRPGRAAAQRC